MRPTSLALSVNMIWEAWISHYPGAESSEVPLPFLLGWHQRKPSGESRLSSLVRDSEATLSLSVEATQGAVIRYPFLALTAWYQQILVSLTQKEPGSPPLKVSKETGWRTWTSIPIERYPHLPVRMKIKSSLKDNISVELQILCIFQPKISMIKPQCHRCQNVIKFLIW